MSSPVPHSDLVDACLAYCEKAGISPSTLGHRTVNDGQFITRLQKGGRCWPETEQKVRDFMRRHPPRREGAAA